MTMEAETEFLLSKEPTPEGVAEAIVEAFTGPARPCTCKPAPNPDIEEALEDHAGVIGSVDAKQFQKNKIMVEIHGDYKDSLIPGGTKFVLTVEEATVAEERAISDMFSSGRFTIH